VLKMSVTPSMAGSQSTEGRTPGTSVGNTLGWLRNEAQHWVIPVGLRWRSAPTYGKHPASV
jgi:hypothetical protein